MTKRDFLYVKNLIGQGYSNKEITEMSGRGHSTIATIKQQVSFNAYKSFVKERNKISTQNVLDRQAAATKKSLTGPVVFVGIAGGKKNLEQLLTQLDDSFKEFNSNVTDIIAQIVELKVAKFKEEKESEVADIQQSFEDQLFKKDSEIADLKTVVEAAKSSNLMSNLRSRLMG